MGSTLRTAVRVVVWVYRAGLVRYPRRLRDPHGDDMVALFDAMAEEGARREGWWGLTKVVARAAAEWLRPLPGPLPGREGPPAAREFSEGRGTMWSGMLEDLRLGARSLGREPRFMGLVTGVLAMGIALTVGVFAVVDAYLLAPLPFPEPERLVSVVESGDLSWDEVDDVFEKAVSWDLDVFTVIGDGRPELLSGAWITPDFLDTYGVVAALGRGFLPEEAGRDAAPVAMISHDLWRTRFGADPGIVGQTFQAFTSDRPEHAEIFQIVGVLPADFWYVNAYTEVFAPIRGPRALYAGRLRTDTPIERAEQMLTEMSLAKLAEVPPDFRVELSPLKDEYVASVRPTLVALQAGVLLVLLVACANGGVLLLIRSARRERELGVRRALGASGWRVGRQLLAEGLIISVIAGAAGALMATWGLDLAKGSLEASLGRAVPGGVDQIAVDAPVLAAAAVVCALVALGFGLLPLAAGRNRGFRFLREANRGSDSVGTRRIRGGLVAAEVALSLALLTGAGLMVRSALHLQSRDLGFDPDGIVRSVAGVRAASYPDPADRVSLFSSLADRVRARPGVESVALANRGLFTGRLWPNVIEARRDGVGYRARAIRWAVSQTYFETLGIRLIEGRDFARSDAAGTEPVVVVSESLARELWPEQSAIGQHLRMSASAGADMGSAEEDPWRRVIGVVSDIVGELAGTTRGYVYETYRQANPQWMNVLVQGSLTAPEVETEVASALAVLDPDAPLYDIGLLDETVAEALAPSRDVATMLAVFAFFAFGLAVLGLYGVVSYAARQSRRAVAIRMALGADGASVTRLFVRQALLVVLAGVLLGSVGGLGFGRMMAGQLYGVEPGDPLTHGGVALALLMASVVAVWIPARSASRADPMAVLRDE